ncbi:MAG: anti-sigma factor domain-containing protein [Phycisphaerae bacterium]
MSLHERDPFNPMDDRLEELLADEALGCLDEADAAELARLRAERPAEAAAFQADFEQLTAEVTLAAVRPEPMPESLVARLHAAAADLNLDGAARTDATVAPAPTTTPAPAPAAPEPTALEPGAAEPAADRPMRIRPEPERTPAGPGLGWKLLTLGGWTAAAAAAVLLLVGPLTSDPADPSDAGSPDLTSQRTALLGSAADAVQLAWAPPSETAPKVQGDVVWSDESDTGYMRFVGLPPLDPSQNVYQLWIFDEARPDAYPVDGGVFNVNSDGEAIVPIMAKLPVSKAKLFAVTVEPPGGVVVSDRDPIVAVASR